MATVDEIMAKVQRFGNDCIGYERSTRIFGPTAKESIRAQVHVEKSRERIRALLVAPVAPDPGLREAIAKVRSQIATERFYLHAEDANTMKMQGQQQLILESFARNMEQLCDSQIIPILDAVLSVLAERGVR